MLGEEKVLGSRRLSKILYWLFVRAKVSGETRTAPEYVHSLHPTKPDIFLVYGVSMLGLTPRQALQHDRRARRAG